MKDIHCDLNDDCNWYDNSSCRCRCVDCENAISEYNKILDFKVETNSIHCDNDSCQYYDNYSCECKCNACGSSKKEILNYNSTHCYDEVCCNIANSYLRQDGRVCSCECIRCKNAAALLVENNKMNSTHCDNGLCMHSDNTRARLYSNTCSCMCNRCVNAKEIDKESSAVVPQNEDVAEAILAGDICRLTKEAERNYYIYGGKASGMQTESKETPSLRRLINIASKLDSQFSKLNFNGGKVIYNKLFDIETKLNSYSNSYTNEDLLYVKYNDCLLYVQYCDNLFVIYVFPLKKGVVKEMVSGQKEVDWNNSFTTIVCYNLKDLYPQLQRALETYPGNVDLKS